jgi:hypothetical protein
MKLINKLFIINILILFFSNLSEDTTGQVTRQSPLDSQPLFTPYNALFPISKDGKWGYMDETGKTVFNCKYEAAGDFSEGLARVKLFGFIGYIDRTGKNTILVGKKYDETGEFHEGMAWVLKGDFIGGYWGYINDKGVEVTAPDVYIWAEDFHEGLARVDGYMPDSTTRSGFMDKDGVLKIVLQFDVAGNFSEGMAPARTGDKWGFIDATGSWAIDPQFDIADEFSDGLAPVKIEKKWGYCDRSGNIVIPCQFYEAKSFSNGFAAVRYGDEQGNRKGYIDVTGNKVIEIPDNFYSHESFAAEGLAMIDTRTTLDPKIGYIDKTGKIVIECQFTYAENFVDGLAHVAEGYGSDRVWGYINHQGEWIWRSDW